MSQVVSRPKRVSLWIYLVLAALFAVGVLLQALWAGMAVLSAPSYWQLHTNFVHAIELLPILMLVAALIGRGGRPLWILPLVAFALISVQYATVAARPSLVAGIHAMNALLIFGVAMEGVRLGAKRLRS